MPHIDLLDRAFFGVTLKQWLVAAATMGGVYVTLSVLRRILARRFGALAARTETQWDDLAVEIIRRTRPYFLLVLSAYAASRVVDFPHSWERVFRAIAVIVVLMQAGVWGGGLIGFGVDHYARQRGGDDAGTNATIKAVGYAARFVLWGLLVVTALQNFGIQITALVTSLGIGGIAIALAVQNILGDLFAALAIVLDKPFVVGDSIQVDNINGNIEHVGLKTTRIRSVNGEQVIISNADLLKSRIRNFKRMQDRRVVFQLDVTYDTAPEKLAQVPELVRAAVTRQPLTKMGRCHLLALAESALRFECVYHVLDPDYDRYADIQHAINLELVRVFREQRIEFAFVSRTIYMKQDAPAASSLQPARS